MMPNARLHVSIDVTGLFWKYRTGVQNYYYGLMEGLTRLNWDECDVDIVLLDRSVQGIHHLPDSEKHQFEIRRVTPLQWVPTFDTPVLANRWKNGLELWNKGVRGLRRQALNFSKQVDRLLEDVDVLHVWNWDIKTVPNRKHVITLFDVIPILYAELFLPGFVDATKASLNFARNDAHQIIAISDFTKSELIRIARIPEDKITVIHLGVRPVFGPIEDKETIESILNVYGVRDHPYLISVGYLDPRKNVKAHVQAFERIVGDKRFQDFHLVLVGPESPSTSQILEAIKSSQVRDRIHITGYVPEDHLIALLNGASVFLYCSLYEGFGFPVLEAMACGTPVVTSNTTSLPEISGDAAMLVDPEDYEQIAEAIKRVLLDDALRKELRQRGIARAKLFTWEECAREHLQVYANCCR